MKKNVLFYLAFSHFLGIGPVRFNKLLEYFGNVQTAYEANVRDIQQAIGAKVGQDFDQFRKAFDAEKTYSDIQKKNITILTREDEMYPHSLLHLSDLPICLYVKGDVSNYDFENESFFAIVGTRKITSYGQQVTSIFSSQLAESGLVIVSGLALGVDAIAHSAALDAKGKTIAFLGCGVDVIYPTENTQLYHRIIENGGLVMSEFPPGRRVQPGLFVSRNRLISGLSAGILVVEGLKDSGSLITARCAAEQGKEVFAPPAPITSQQSEAPNLLLKEGAKMVTSPQDILEEFQLSARYQTQQKNIDFLTSEEKWIYEKLRHEPFLSDDLATHSTLGISQILSILTSLELQGMIERNREGKYQVKM